jgi:hypothetical protein
VWRGGACSYNSNGCSCSAVVVVVAGSSRSERL